MARGVKSLTFLFAGLLSGLALAQLGDPTKPPPDTAMPGDALPGTTAPAASGLQSVILKRQGKPAALINGEVVELGGKVGAATLIKVSEDAVVLKGPDGEETLRLIPSAEKKMEKKKVDTGGAKKLSSPHDKDAKK
jgi:MSHA biogenesis protein MshK